MQREDKPHLLAEAQLATRIRTLHKSSGLLPEGLIAAVCALALSCTYYAQAIFGGQVIGPIDFIYQLTFFHHDKPADLLEPANLLLTDPILKFIPWQYVTREALSQHTFPLWNPYIYAGAPLFANAESAVLYPLNVVGYFLPLSLALNCVVILQTTVAGWGMFLLARALGMRRVGASLAAISFMFGGSLTVWRLYPIGSVYSWAPLLLFLSQRLISMRRWSGAPLISLVLSSQILAGHHQTVFIGLLIWGFFCLYLLWEAYPACGWLATLRTCAALGGAILLGVLLSSIQLLPFAEWLHEGAEVQRRLQRSEPGLSQLLLELASLAKLVVPNLYGNPVWSSNEDFLPINFLESMVYGGIIPLGLAISALFKGAAETRGRRRFFVLLGLGGLLLALNVPGFSMINRLPVFSLVSSPRYRLVFTFCLAILAGYGADQLIVGADTWPALRQKFRVIGSLALGAYAIPLAIYGLLLSKPDSLLAFQRVRDLYPAMLSAFHPGSVAMYAPAWFGAGFALMIMVRRWRLISTPVLTFALLALTLGDLAVFGLGFNPIVPTSYLYPSTASIRLIQQLQAEGQPGRIVSLHDDLAPGTNIPYHFADIGGTDFPSLRYQQLALAGGGTMSGPARIDFPNYPGRLADLLGVRVVISSLYARGEDARDLRRLPIKEMVIYENPDPLPRVRVVHAVEIVPEADAALQRLFAADFDPQTNVILSAPPTITPQPPPTGIQSEASLVEEDFQTLRITVRAAANGVLVISDGYYPGWEASIDGQPAPVFPADHALRGVAVPAGAHEVILRYRPASVRIGAWLSAVGIGILSIIVVTGSVRTFMRRKNQ